MRLDRVATMYFVDPLTRILGLRSQLRIPILMYHSISDRIDAEHYYYEMNTALRVFEEQIRFLYTNGYSSISLEAAIEILKTDRSSTRSVVITFDDGYRDFYTAAYPVLSRYRMKATVFVATSFVGSGRRQFQGKDCLTWSELRELRSNGIDIGSHTVTHPQLESMNSIDIEHEVGRSKQIIEDKLGCPIQSFAYPYAFPESNRPLSAFLTETLVRHGYHNGVSTILGSAQHDSNRFLLPRLPVNTWDDTRLFQAKVEGAYDWMHIPQGVYKRFKKHYLGRDEPAASS